MLKQELKEMLISVRNGAMITPVLNKILRLIGCERCYNKGYGTQTLFATSSIGDFERAEPTTWKMNEMVFCDCDRGKQLEKLWKENEKHIRDKEYKK